MSGNLPIAPEQLLRPRTRADCVDGPRPCPWVGCRHHLAIEVTAKHGSIKSRRGLGTLPIVKSAQHWADDYSDRVVDDLETMEDTCREDTPEPMTAREIADVMGMHPTAMALIIKDAERKFREVWFKMYGEAPDLP